MTKIYPTPRSRVLLKKQISLHFMNLKVHCNMPVQQVNTRQDGLAVMLWTCILVVLCSDLIQDTSYSDGFCGFPQSVQANATIVH
jgi:hypothetical protein